MNFSNTEDEIKNYLKRSFLSLISRRRRSRSRAQTRAGSLAAARIPGMFFLPQPLRLPAEAGGARRRGRHPDYVRGHYLSCPQRSIDTGQPLFRVA